VRDDEHELVRNLREVLNGVSAKTAKEAYNDATYYREEIRELFRRGQIALRSLSLAESTYLHIVWAIIAVLQKARRVPAGFEGLEESLADIYYGNFSVFQSLPDVWAIDQLFPILPIHRLNEKPNEFGTLADITCDSDGKIEKFIDLRDIKETLPLHSLRNGEPYYIGVCLTGAYQDVLGDLHNLFGEAHEVLVTVDEQGRGRIEDVLPGESCERVLEYMNYDRTEILDSIGKQLRRAGRSLKKDEVRAIYREFEEVFPKYTYLER
jgi:arginine decarboxylase